MLPVPRGKIGALVQVGEKLLGFNNDQFLRASQKSQINTGAHIAGALIGGLEQMASSLKIIEKCMVKETSELKGSGGYLNIQELRKMIEEYGNLEKLVR